MPLPASFQRDGFVPVRQGRARMRLRSGKLLKPLLIGTEGETDTGKTEFLFSLPGPKIIIVLDRQYEPCLDNPNPPTSRNLDDCAVKVISVPPNTTAKQPTYLEYFQLVRAEFYKALTNPDAVAVAIDGDSDFWELQRLAEWGKIVGIYPATKYSDVYASRRAMTARAWDSGKIIVGTNKVKDEWVTVYNADGTPVKESDGSEKRQKTGLKERQGYPDQSYLWNIQIRHLRQKPATKVIERGPLRGKEVKTSGQWGIQILKCKSNTTLEGAELWGEQANFRGLVEFVYPDVDPEEFGL